MKETTEKIIRRKFPEREYALLEEVSDKAGFSRSRSADFIVVGLWPSRGLHITGIERKSWRGDWLGELKKPEKQENHFQYCDFFYLLTDNEGVAKLEEIPSTWGWMHIDMDGKFKIMKEAPKNEPHPVSKHFLAAMLKRATGKQGWTRDEDIEDRINSAKETGKVDGEYRIRQSQKDLDELRSRVKLFETTTGIKIDAENNWKWRDTKKVGELVNFLLESDPKQLEDKLKSIKTQAELIINQSEIGISLLSNKEK